MQHSAVHSSTAKQLGRGHAGLSTGGLSHCSAFDRAALPQLLGNTKCNEEEHQRRKSAPPIRRSRKHPRPCTCKPRAQRLPQQPHTGGWRTHGWPAWRLVHYRHGSMRAWTSAGWGWQGERRRRRPGWRPILGAQPALCRSARASARARISTWSLGRVNEGGAVHIVALIGAWESCAARPSIQMSWRPQRALNLIASA